VTSRTALNVIRRRQTERRYVDTSVPEDIPLSKASSDGSELRAESRVLLAAVRVRLSRLSPKRSEALVLHDVLGHSLVEVAALTGVTVAAAQSRLVRGRKELRAHLVKDGLVEDAE